MLAPLLEGVDRLVLAGDIWQQRKMGEGVQKALRMLTELTTMIEARGIALDLLRGNHDPTGGAGVCWLANRQVLVTHGDAVYDDATPWSREIGNYRREVDAIVEKYRPVSHLAEACADRAREIAMTIRVVPLPRLPPPLNFFATAFWPPSRPLEMIRVWRGMGDQGISFLKHSGEGARVLICGHFHRAGIWEKEGYLMVNTGAFMKGSQPWMVDLEDGAMIASGVRLKDGTFVPGEVKGRWLLR